MTQACEHCGGRVRHRVIREFRDDALLGLPGVVLVNAVTETVCTRCRRVEGITIPNPAGAIAAAGIARVMHPVKLTGAELRAVRRAAGRTAKDLANVLDVRAETVSRWETGAEPIGSANEKLARLALGAALDIGQGAPSLVAFDPDAIVAMQLRAPRAGGRPPEIRLELVRVRNAASAGAWDQVKRAA
jgi:transcriptional regulator with XRE-family HTH domain